MTSERNYGIDMLRILSMFLIVTLHVIGQGGLMIRNTGHLDSYYAVWFVETAAMCAVNVYGLISGYVGVESKFKPGRILELWLQVFFYSVILMLVFGTMHPDWINEKILRKTLMPVMWRTYWYFSCYFVLFMFAPFLNKMVRSLTKQQCRALMFVIIFSFSLLTLYPKAYDVDTLTLLGGYSFVWLAALYLMGACIRRLELKRRSAFLYLAVYAAMTVIAWIYKILMENHTRKVYGEARYGKVLVTYTAPTILICALCLLMIFMGLNIRNRWAVRIIKRLSAATLSVYIIHTHPMIWEHILKNAFSAYYKLPAAKMIPFILANALWIYLLCSLIDQFRIVLFRVLGVRNFCERIAQRMIALLRLGND